MPWKETKDPYHIWLSEIILQQTRVQQGWNYFLKFKKVFPTVFDLAKASEQEVLAQWQGLGYYSRARNLHATARIIARELNGKFPTSKKGLQSLKGVGDYTAAAISSFAFDQAQAVVDGNVFRIYSRLFGIDVPRNSSKGKKLVQEYADRLLDNARSADFNQALLNFGALHCKPSNPLCHSCPFSESCYALRENRVEEFPLKLQKKPRKKRHFNYLVLSNKGSYLMKKREAKDIWKGLFDFPLFESKKPKRRTSIQNHFVQNGILQGTEKLVQGPRFSQTLTHQTIMAQFLLFETPEKRRDLEQGMTWISEKNLQFAGFPKVVDLFFAETVYP